MDKLLDDMATLLNAGLSIDEVFYFAAMIHLVFVKIHPFADGNGRTARLLEKWFIAAALGMEAWKIQSEKLYQTHLKAYYDGLDIGKEYGLVDYDLAFPFLKMLPMALRVK